MIDPRDLRIGNYLECGGDSLEVIGINDEVHGWVIFCDPVTKQIKQEDRSRFVRFINPIPITDEWLEKFGFELKEKCYEIKHGVGIHSVYFGEYLQYRFSSLINASHLVHSIRYVHELQNLIYVLTGQELTIGGGE